MAELKSITLGDTTLENVDKATLQEKLVSGTNIKTINGESVLGSGNIFTGNELQNGAVEFNGTITEGYAGKLIVEPSTNGYSFTEYNTYSTTESTKELVDTAHLKTINNQSLLGSGNLDIQAEDELFIVPIDYSTLVQNPQYPDYDLKTGDLLTPYTYEEIVAQKDSGKIICAKVVNFWGSGYADTGFIAPMNFVSNSFLAYYPFADWDNTEYDMCYLTITIRKSGTDTKVDVQYDNFGNPNRKPTTTIYNKDSTAEDFAPLELATVMNGSTEYKLYKFLYRTDALPEATSKIFDLSTLMTNYTIFDWSRISGFISNGHMLSSGRTDNTNNACIIQQASKNNKQITLRSYANLTSYTALLEVEFIGTKNA